MSNHVIYCNICLFEYDEERKPLILSPCGHTLCKKCIDNIIQNKCLCPYCNSSLDKKSNELIEDKDILKKVNKQLNEKEKPKCYVCSLIIIKTYLRSVDNNVYQICKKCANKEIAKIYDENTDRLKLIFDILNAKYKEDSPLNKIIDNCILNNYLFDDKKRDNLNIEYLNKILSQYITSSLSINRKEENKEINIYSQDTYDSVLSLINKKLIKLYKIEIEKLKKELSKNDKNNQNGEISIQINPSPIVKRSFYYKNEYSYDSTLKKNNKFFSSNNNDLNNTCHINLYDRSPNKYENSLLYEKIRSKINEIIEYIVNKNDTFLKFLCDVIIKSNYFDMDFPSSYVNKKEDLEQSMEWLINSKLNHLFEYSKNMIDKKYLEKENKSDLKSIFDNFSNLFKTILFCNQIKSSQY